MIDEIDVTITTKNNEDTIKNCIESIKKYIPYKNIIILDDSTDRTPQIAKELGAIVYNVPELLGKKRYLQAKFSETDWIASIDSDVFVFPNWWEELSKEIKPEVGVISGFLSSDFEKIFPAYESYTKFWSVRFLNKTGGGSTMANNIINRKLLLSCKDELLNKNIHAGEDVIIGQKIKELGYEWRIIKKITGFHFHKDPIEHHLMAYRREGESIIKRYGFSLKGIIKLLFFSLANIEIKWLKYSYNSRHLDFKLHKFLLKLYCNLVKGGFQELNHILKRWLNGE